MGFSSDSIPSLSGTDKDAEFELDNDVDLTSPFLCGMVSGGQLWPNFNGLAPPMVTTRAGIGNREATGEERENMWWHVNISDTSQSAVRMCVCT